MFLRLDLALRAQAHPHQLRADDLSQSRLGQDEEVVVRAPQNDERCDHARLGGQQQRRARLTRSERLNVIRDHPLQVVGRIRPGDADELPRSHSHIHGV